MKLKNVYRRWKLVLDLIIEDEGRNAKVKSKRGKLYSAPDAEVEVFKENDEVSKEAIEAINVVEAELDY